MYNKWIKATVLLCIPWTILTSTGESTARYDAEATASVGAWTGIGEQKFVTSFPKVGNDGARVVSRLRYPLNSQMNEFTMEVPVGKQYFMRMGYANNTIKPGRGDDIDWDYSQNQNMWYYGTFSTSGGSQYYNIELVNKQVGFSTVVGYRAQTNFFLMQDGHYEIINYDAEANQSLIGLNSTYEITYEGIWIGLQGEKAINPKVTVEGSVFYSPYLQVKAAGDWNLRPMTFEEKGNGQGVEGNVALKYAPHQQYDISVGYRYRWLRQEHGIDKTYYNGSTYFADWDEAVSIQRGIIARINYRF